MVVVAGCVVGPEYKRPVATATMPAAYAGATTNEWKVAEPQGNLPKGNWWEVLGDAELNGLETDAAAANQTLKAAVARFQEARELANVARAGFFPHVGVNGSAVRERDSANRSINGVAQGVPDTYTTFTVPLDLNYEVDLWGRVRRSVEAARAGEAASADDLAGVRLAIQAELATDWFTLRSLDAQVTLLRTNIEVFRRSFELTRNRRAGGVATDLDVSQAETVLRTAEAQLPATELQRGAVAARHCGCWRGSRPPKFLFGGTSRGTSSRRRSFRRGCRRNCWSGGRTSRRRNGGWRRRMRPLAWRGRRFFRR